MTNPFRRPPNIDAQVDQCAYDKPQFRVEFVASDESVPYHIYVDDRLTAKVATQASVSGYLAAFTDGYHYRVERAG